MKMPIVLGVLALLFLLACGGKEDISVVPAGDGITATLSDKEFNCDWAD